MKHTASRIGAGAAALAFIVTLGTMAISAPRGEARQKVDGGAATCTWGSKTYSDGAVITLKNGDTYRCENGSWKYLGR
jgi:hypothetical protein